MPSFLHNIANKAQTALNSSPLAAHIPSSLQGPRPVSPDAAAQPSANQAAAQGGQKSHTFEAIQHQFRSLQQQYSTTTPVQKVITASKGVAIDLDCVARDTKAQSKELYTFGQSEAEDIKDVTDRLAYLNFVHGSLATTLAQKLDAGRRPFKELRDAETALQPRRAARANIETQLSRVENDPKKSGELREQLRIAELEDGEKEREIEILKRKAIRESEQQKWAAIREYAEKLLLLSQAAVPITAALPGIPPTLATPYTGAKATAAARASLQRALDNYKTGHINLAPTPEGADLSRSDTASFGESHAVELSSIAPYSPDQHANAPAIGSTTAAPPFPIPQKGPTPPVVSSTSPLPPASAPSPSFPVPVKGDSPPINPAALNLSPAPIPAVVQPQPVAPALAADPSATTTSPQIVPTVAETGIPVTAGASGPGPATGSLHDLKHASSQSGVLQPPPSHYPIPTASQPSSYPSAEDEKRRLAAQYSQAGPTSSAPTSAPSPGPSTGAPHHEIAEEEKKRLEREERDRILGIHPGLQPPRDNNAEEDLPPYQEPALQ